ncbi:MAG: Lrp/AsnC family transcriptional regulator [Candidatus Micrarchaeota archaeon]|nr:Lrp/AsnC family transcriptional regulator [Candidatus Micrarchaeota archaeon]
MEAKLDEIDEGILALLEKDAKMRMHIIAKKLGVPASTVHHRIKRMEKEGVIEGWGVRKGYKRMGYGVKAHVLVFVDVTVLKRLKKTQQDIAGALSKIPEVESAEIVTGEADLIISVRARDMDDYRRILLGKIQAVEGITETKTMMVIS